MNYLLNLLVCIMAWRINGSKAVSYWFKTFHTGCFTHRCGDEGSFTAQKVFNSRDIPVTVAALRTATKETYCINSLLNY